MSAVSKKLMPHSSARLTNGLLAASSSVHGCHSGDPYVIMPRQMPGTFRPVEPSRTYSIGEKSTTGGRLSAFRTPQLASATAYHEDQRSTQRSQRLQRADRFDAAISARPLWTLRLNRRIEAL